MVIAGVIGLNVVTMSLEFYMMPDVRSVKKKVVQHFFPKIKIYIRRFKALTEILDIFNYVFTAIFLIEAIMRVSALGFRRYIKEK